jgi:thiosulfate/3-mercaptopyruvate sulfurtransferase
MTEETVGVLITVPQLAGLLAAETDLTLLDVRWRLGGPPGRELYAAGHVPGAVFVDLDRDLAAAPGPGGRHPLPATADFETTMRLAGVSDGRPVVVYDDADSTAAARAWWLLRYFGHPSVRVLDGGFRAWSAAGHPVQRGGRSDPAALGASALGDSAPGHSAPDNGLGHSLGHSLDHSLDHGLGHSLDHGALDHGALDHGAPSPGVTAAPGDFTARPGHLGLLDAAAAASFPRAGLLLDARSVERYRGEAEHVDPVAGHIPGAVSAPTTENVAPDGTFKPAADLAARFQALGAAADRPVGAYCGSGVTAAHEVLALAIAGIPAALYVGSWSNWITNPTAPVSTGQQP